MSTKEAIAERLEKLTAEDQEKVLHYVRSLPLSDPEQARRNGKSSDCLAIALEMASDLGPEFSSENPHALTDRGCDWFVES
jgi:hypothetical protein